MTPEQLARQIETEIMTNIAKALKGGDYGSVDWQTEKLAQLGRLTKQNTTTILRNAGKLDTATNEAIKNGLLDKLDLLDTAFKEGGSVAAVLPGAVSPALKATIAAMENSTAIMLEQIGQTMISGAEQIYKDTVTKVTSKVLAGVSSKNEAMRQAISEWSAQGLTGLIDKAGREWKPDTYLNMRIRTETRSATTELTISRSAEYGNDLVEVDSHAGARPNCFHIANCEGLAIYAGGS